MGGVADGYPSERYSNAVTTIGKLDAYSRWSKAGDLSTARYGHGAIFDGEFFIIVGGYRPNLVGVLLSSEKCEFGDDGLTCTEQSPSLYGYSFYPELFLVEKDFCKSL